MTQADRITKARMGVILSAPFFGSLLMRLQMKVDNTVPTFCTDGRSIMYNEAFCASLSDPELRMVLVHEVCHCAQGHLWRCGDRDPKKWNRAIDYAVNNMLDGYVSDERKRVEQSSNSKFTAPWEMPKGKNAGLLDHQFDGLSSEEIYARLPDSAGNGEASCGEITQPAEEKSPEGPTLEEEWKIAVTQAATVARMRGQLPGSLERLVGELLEPKVPWRQVLREFVRQLSRDDYSWRRTNRRYAHQGVVLPSLYGERVGRLAIGVDTSGSIGAHELAEFQAEIQATLDECRPECVEVIYCDARVNGIDEFFPGDTVRLRPLGGGGTAFEPVFNHLAEADEQPVALIYLTDGYGSFPDAEPDYPVLWATTASDKYPFGQIVSIK